MKKEKQHLLKFVKTRGPLSFREFTQEALFGEPHGYYRQQRPRVGHGRENDFATNLQHGPALGPLLVAVWKDIIGEDFLKEADLFLIGEEAGQSLKPFIPEGSFQNIYSLPYGAEWPDSKRRVLFANEVLDAQPFERFRWNGEHWQQVGVEVSGDDFAEILFDDPVDSEALAFMEDLPRMPTKEWTLDWSPAAEQLLQSWCSGSWEGCFFTLDYGYSLLQLLSECPKGTARGYILQQPVSLLEAAGVGDLTHHLCWDRLKAVLGEAGFSGPDPLRQDRFFFRYGQSALQKMVESQQHDPEALNPLMGHAKALALPGSLGSRFHALWGLRINSSNS